MSILNNLVYWLTIKPKLNMLRHFLPESKIHPTGSRYICDIPQMFTDVDFVVFSDKDISSELTKLGYKSHGTEPRYEDDSATFISWRKGKVNLIVSESMQFYERFVVATHLCKKFNVFLKIDRINIFYAIRTLNDTSLINASTYLYRYKFREEIISALNKFKEPYGKTMVKAYMAKHGLS